ncbi:unnamed protein product [Lampetra fluviatilis]
MAGSRLSRHVRFRSACPFRRSHLLLLLPPPHRSEGSLDRRLRNAGIATQQSLALTERRRLGAARKEPQTNGKAAAERIGRALPTALPQCGEAHCAINTETRVR